MAGFLKKIFKVLCLVVLAALAIPVGIMFTIAHALWFCLQNISSAIWMLIYNFFSSVSKVVSVCAASFLNATLIKQGSIPFGTHSVSAVLGANQREMTLTDLGIWLSDFLDSIEKHHCRKAAQKADI